MIQVPETDTGLFVTWEKASIAQLASQPMVHASIPLEHLHSEAACVEALTPYEIIKHILFIAPASDAEDDLDALVREQFRFA